MSFMEVKSNKNICVCTNTYSKEFDTFEELLKWTEKEIEKEIEKESEIKVGNIVKVIDTGKVYTTLSEESFYNLYLNSVYDIGEILKIVSKLNHEGLGYIEGIYEINDSDFKVLAIFSDKSGSVEYVLLEPSNKIKYDGYYILSKKGVKNA